MLLRSIPEVENVEAVVDSILVSLTVESELGVMTFEVLVTVAKGIVLSEYKLGWIGPDESLVIVVEVVE